LLIIILSTPCYAQISTPEKGSKWVYHHSNIASFGPLFSTYKRDTLIGDKSAIVLDETFYDVYRDPGKPNIDSFSDVGNIIFIEDSVVQYLNNGKFETLYDFGAEVGAKWEYYFAGKDTLIAYVVGKGQDDNLGAFLDIEYIDGFGSRRDTIYEKTLGGTSYVIPWDETLMQLDGHEGGPLTCFSNSQGRYSEKTWTSGGSPCTDIIDKLSIEERYASNIFTIYPNPSNGFIKIFGSTQPQKMEVYNVLGELVYTSINVFEYEDLSSQTLYIKLWRKNGKVEVHRVVVE